MRGQASRKGLVLDAAREQGNFMTGHLSKSPIERRTARSRPKPGTGEVTVAAGVVGTREGGMFGVSWLDSVHAEFRLGFVRFRRGGTVVSSNVVVLWKRFCWTGGQHWPAVSAWPRGPGQPLALQIGRDHDLHCLTNSSLPELSVSPRCLLLDRTLLSFADILTPNDSFRRGCRNLSLIF